MRKMILLYLLIMVVIFFIPIILTNCKGNKSDVVSSSSESSSDKKETESKEEKQENIFNNKIINDELDKKLYDYEEYSRIKLINTTSKNIEEIALDEYLYGVVSAEMPVNYDIEALKAQAVVARTYTLYNIINNKEKHGDGIICTSPSCCQAWIAKEDRLNRWDDNEKNANWEKIVEAVDSTKGEIITFNGQVIDAFFHSNSGGKTEKPVNVWGGTNYPYLTSVETAGEDAYMQYQSTVEISKEEFEKKIKTKYADFTIKWDENECIKILEHTEGNRVKKIKIGNKELSGVEIRNLISLKSANFNYIITEKNIIFSVIGYGHGVGMSQTGADSMAKSGANYKEIIKHFYNGVEVIKY